MATCKVASAILSIVGRREDNRTCRARTCRKFVVKFQEVAHSANDRLALPRDWLFSTFLNCSVSWAKGMVVAAGFRSPVKLVKRQDIAVRG